MWVRRSRLTYSQKSVSHQHNHRNLYLPQKLQKDLMFSTRRVGSTSIITSLARRIQKKHRYALHTCYKWISRLYTDNKKTLHIDYTPIHHRHEIKRNGKKSHGLFSLRSPRHWLRLMELEQAWVRWLDCVGLREPGRVPFTQALFKPLLSVCPPPRTRVPRGNKAPRTWGQQSPEATHPRNTAALIPMTKADDKQNLNWEVKESLKRHV